MNDPRRIAQYTVRNNDGVHLVDNQKTTSTEKYKALLANTEDCTLRYDIGVAGVFLESPTLQHLKPTETRIYIYILYLFVCVAYYRQIACIPTDFAICFP